MTKRRGTEKEHFILQDYFNLLVVNTALDQSRKMLTVGFFHVFKVCSLPLFPKQLYFEVFLEHLCKKREKLILDLVSCSVRNGNDRMGGGRRDSSFPLWH